MLEKITQNWWMLAVRGVAAVIFGVLALIWPGQTLQALVLVFGAFALVDGIFAIFAGIAASRYFDRWWAVLLEGVVKEYEKRFGALNVEGPAAQQ